MPLQTNLNVAPYYDDYDSLKNYYQILYKPGFPVQARELTQMQTMTQNQISSLAQRFLAEGDNIVPGEYGIQNPVSYVRVSSITQGSTAQDFVGYTLTGVTSGVTAVVTFAVGETDDDDTTFYVDYSSSGNTSEYLSFLEGETLTSNTPNFYTATVGVTNVSRPTTTFPMGAGVLFDVQEGTFFVDGYMVRNDKQTIIVDKYSTTPNGEVGFLVNEEIINSSEDSTLLDNATGSSNFAAPGADRLKISLTLVFKEPNTTLPNFIALCTLIQGNIQGKPGDTVKWDWLYDVLAKRTFDESGDYIVTDFAIKQLEYTNTDTQAMGVFDANDDGLYPPVPQTGSDTPLTFEEANSYYALEVAPGAAYVQGYQIGYKQPIYLFGEKARTQSFRQDSTTTITEGYNISITHSYGTPDFANISGVANAIGLDQITLYRNFADGYVGEATKGTQLGEPINYGNAPWTTYHIICSSDLDAVDDPAYTTIYKKGNSAVVNGVTPLVRGDTYGGVTVLVAIKVNPVPSGVLTPRYLIPETMVDDQDGFFGYNSSQKLGIVTSNFFTQIPVVNLQNTGIDWVIGDIVYGDRSRATGVVEIGSQPDVLVISSMNGEFENGETITQGEDVDEKVARILSPGETFGFEFITGAGGSVSGSTDLSGITSLDVTALGSTLVLNTGEDFTSTASEVTLTETGRTKLFNFPYPQGSALAANRVNYEVTASDGALGFAVLLPGTLTNTLTKTKSMFANLAGYDKFASDISTQSSVDSEIFSLAGNSLFTGKEDANYLTCDSFSGDPSLQLEFGDVVTFVDDDGTSVSKMVYFATAPVGRSEVRAKSRIYFTTTLQADVTGKTVQRIRVKSRGASSQNLLFQLPQNVISTLESNQEETGIDYESYREFIISIDQGSYSFTLQAAGSTTTDTNTIQSFLDSPNEISVAVIKNTGDSLDVANLTGRVLTIDQDYNENGYVNGILLQENNTKMTVRLDFTNGIPSQSTLKIITPVKMRNAIAKKKVLKKGVDFPVDLETASKAIVPLDFADGFRLNAVLTDAGQDITDNYYFDNGQRDNVYQLARLQLKPGRPPASTSLVVNVDFFEHSGTSDFFSVDSYTHDDSNISYSEIPAYNPIAGVPRNSEFTAEILVQLRDSVDFRPIVNTNAQGTGAEPSELSAVVDGLCTQGTANGSRLSDTNFRDAVNSGNAFVPNFPIPKTRFECDIQYYLPRVDSLFLEKTGALTLLQGVPGEPPTPTPDLQTGIRLYDFYLPPYTFSADDIDVTKYNYKRFQMKDIAKIERRVDRVEELVTLSILEQSALNMSVRDAVTGLDRFKNGIVVDNFRDHSKGEVGNQQYRNSVDPKLTYLRSACWVDQAELEEKYDTDEDRAIMGYVVNDGIATLTFEEVDFIDQPNATRSINLQPYSVFPYKGELVLDPPIDTFQDVNQLPNLVIRDNNLFDAMVNMTGELRNSGIGTVWGDWENTGRVSTSVSTISGRGPGVSGSAQASSNGGAASVQVNGGATTVRIQQTTTSVQQARVQTQTFLNVQSGGVQNTSYGERVTDVQLARTMRSRPVFFSCSRLKPNTKYYMFLDEVDISAWVNPDEPNDTYTDGLSRMKGNPGTAQKGFGTEIISDDIGNVQGIILIPNGRQPVVGSLFFDMARMEYVSSGPTRSFTTGTKSMKITSSARNSEDTSTVEGFADTTYTASGVILDKQETVVSTRLPSFSSQTVRLNRQTRTESNTETTGVDVSQDPLDIRLNLTVPPPVPPVTRVIRETIIRQAPRPVPDDPVAQTFLVPEDKADGVFVTGIDLFFQTKDNIEGVEVYMTPTDAEVPTRTIIPHSIVPKSSSSLLRVRVNLPSGIDSVTIPEGSTVIGGTSGATGVVASAITFESTARNADRNVENTTYDIVLSNYMFDFVPNESITCDASTLTSRTDFRIVQEEVQVTRVDLKNFGDGYTQETTTVTFSAPELRGGVAATGEVLVDKGKVYQFNLTSAGSGYIKAPSVAIGGDGDKAEAVVRTTKGERAVIMGVATSDDATAPTHFEFAAPVYLMGNTWYSFVAKSSHSLNYMMYTMKLGENNVGTNTRVVNQSSKGALFMSQNGGLWTEDQTMDVKFKLYRADFADSNNALIDLQNSPVQVKLLGADPFETNDTPLTDPDATAFGTNPKIVRVSSFHHGLEPNDYVAISGAVGFASPATIGGIPEAEFNGLHTVVDAGLNTFTIKLETDATSGTTGGGSVVEASYNLPYEVIDIVAGAQVFGSSQFAPVVRSTQAAGVTLYNQANQYTRDVAVSLDLMDSYYFNGAKQVANYLNEVKYSDVFHLAGEQSLTSQVVMSTVDPNVSPVLDLTRTNATVVRNLIDNPKPTDSNLGGTTTTITLNDVDVSAMALATNDSFSFTNGSTTRSALVKSYNPTTKRVILKGQFAKEFLDSSTIVDTATANVGVASVVGSDAEFFVPETNNNGSVYSKWQSRLFEFENVCDGIELRTSTVLYGNKNENGGIEATNVRAYFRPRNIGFDGELTSVNWIPFNSDGLPDQVEQINPRSADDVDPRRFQPQDWLSLTWSIQDIAQFDAVAIKIVMTADNPAQAPIIDDFQLVCSE